VLQHNDHYPPGWFDRPLFGFRVSLRYRLWIAFFAFMPGLALGGRFPAPNALLECSFQPDRLLVLLKQIRKRLVGELLKGLACVIGDSLDGLPRLIIELDPLADHQRFAPPADRLPAIFLIRQSTAQGPVS